MHKHQGTSILRQAVIYKVLWHLISMQDASSILLGELQMFMQEGAYSCVLCEKINADFFSGNWKNYRRNRYKESEGSDALFN